MQTVTIAWMSVEVPDASDPSFHLLFSSRHAPGEGKNAEGRNGESHQ
jgi:hypothetical protein